MADPNLDVDPRLLDSIKQASEDYPYQVVIKPTGGYRPNDTRFHGKHAALDINIIDPETGKAFPDYQNEESFRTYEQFAQKVRQVQQDKYPELNKSLRWGGYFPGTKKYGAVDLMHFDIGGDKIAAGGGDWETGLSASQRKLLPNAISVGMASNQSADDMIAQAKQAGDKATGGGGASIYDQVKSDTAANIPKNELTNMVRAYQSGKMTPEEAKDFEDTVHKGEIALPVGVKIGGSPPVKQGEPSPVQLTKGEVDAYNKGATNPYDKGAMSDKDRMEMDKALHDGEVALPSGAVLNPHYMGLGEKVSEAVTGNLRSTDATKNLPEVGVEHGNQPPLLAGLDDPGGKKGALVAAAIAAGAKGPQLQQILKAQFPDLGFAQDEKGNVIVGNNKTGAEYVLDRPGMTARDLLQTVVVGAAFSPAAKATTIAGGALANAATEAGLQTVQKAAGGNYDPGAIATAGAVGGAFPAAMRVAAAAAPVVKGAVARVMGKEAEAAAGAPAREAGAAVEGAGATPATPPPEAPPTAAAGASSPPPAPPVPPVAPSVAPGAAAGAAAEAGTNSAAATLGDVSRGSLAKADVRQAAADVVQADPKIVQAAEELGMSKHMEPSFVSTNSAYQQVEQGVKQVIGSEAGKVEKANLLEMSTIAKNEMEKIGASTDISEVSEGVKKSLSDTVQRLKQNSDQIYDKIRAAIPAKTEAPANNVLAFINKRADELGGVKNLTSMEKTIYAKLSPQQGVGAGSDLVKSIEAKVANGEALSKEETKAYIQAKYGANKAADVPTIKQPTYALLDDVRRDVGDGLSKQGVFTDAPTAIKKQLYSALTKDQEAIADAHGMGEHWQIAKQAVAMRKGVENDLMSLFGKQVDGSLKTALGTATEALRVGDPTKFDKILHAIRLTPPDMRKQVVSSTVSSVLEKNARDGHLRFGNYANWYDGLLKNKHSMNAVMSNIPPDAARMLRNLYEVSRGIRSAHQYAVRTGLIQTLGKDFQGTDGLVAKLYNAAYTGATQATKHGGAHGLAELAGRYILGFEGLGAVTGIAHAVKSGFAANALKPEAQKAVDALIASPEFKEAAIMGAKGDVKGASSKLAFSKPFIAFARSVGNPREMTDRQKWVMQALETKNNNQN
jgi:hypothetical protein